MTRVLAPYTDMHPATLKALDAWAPHAEIVWTGDDGYAYWRAIADRWTGEDDLVIVEHDIEIGPGTLGSFEGCGWDWCTFSYAGPYVGRATEQFMYTESLGCTRFSARLQRAVRAVTEPSLYWHFARLDLQLGIALKAAGFLPHCHGEVTHHHPYGSQFA